MGGLDEIYREGNFEDDDFCARARLAGYQLAILNDVFVFHHERRTFEDNNLKHEEALARKVLIATNGYSGPLSMWHRRRVIPIGSYQISTEPLGSVAYSFP